MAPHGFCQCGCGERTRIADRTNREYGHVIGEPVRFRVGHQNRGRRKAVRYVEEDRGHDTPCWIWQLAIQSNGYGHFGDRRSGFTGQAHRWYYEREHGVLPEGAHIDHLCRVRACVNPAHMEPVTCAENARRGDNTKLTYADVAEIKRLREDGLLQREVAEQFGIVRQTVSEIERGVTWSAPGGVIPVGA